MADGCGHRGFSQTFYREKVHEKHFGFKDLESFMQGFWEPWACSKGKLHRSANGSTTLLKLAKLQTQKICS